MKQKIKTSLHIKTIYSMLLIFCFGFPLYIINKDDLWVELFNIKNHKTLIIYFLFFLGIISIYKIFLNSKSVFIKFKMPIEEKKELIKSIGNSKNFKNLSDDNIEITKLSYQKYALGLRYEIHFYLHENYIEFNPFCTQDGIFDFGTRNRIIKKIKGRLSIQNKN